MRLPTDWEALLAPFLNTDEFYQDLEAFLKSLPVVIPRKEKIFAVFHKVPAKNVCCVLYGEDPYPRVTSANGIAFWDAEINSWQDKTVGNSMKNILKALLVAHGLATYQTPISHCRKIAMELGIKGPGNLFRHWLAKGVLPVNVSLTFSSFKEKQRHFAFWQPFHKALIKALNHKQPEPFYILWGKKAQRLKTAILESIDDPQKIIKNGHPTFIHQFLNPDDPTSSPFREIEQKTGFSWL